MTLRKKYSKIRKCVIYEIVCNITGERYIGSTLNYRKRKSTHKQKDNTTESKYIILRGNFQFNEIETFNCKYELTRLLKEQYYLDNTNNINKQRAYTSIKKKTEYIQNYYKSNKKDRKSYNMKYTKNNKEKIKERISSIYICKCGRKIQKGNKTHHEKTKIHKKYIDNNINE